MRNFFLRPNPSGKKWIKMQGTYLKNAQFCPGRYLAKNSQFCNFSQYLTYKNLFKIFFFQVGTLHIFPDGFELIRKHNHLKLPRERALEKYIYEKKKCSVFHHDLNLYIINYGLAPFN